MSQRIDKIGLLAGFGRLRLVAIGTLVASVFLLWLLAGQVREVTALAVEARKPPPEVRASVGKRYFAERDYERLMSTLRLNNPAVEFELARGGTHVRVKLKDIARYDAWIFALYGLQGYGANVAWEAESICLGKCPDGLAAVAHVKAFTQDLRRN